MNVTVKIENSYTDEHQSTNLVEVEAPEDVSNLDSWWNEVVFDHTGDGHYTEVYKATGKRLGSCYTATIIQADNPVLVGCSNDWLD